MGEDYSLEYGNDEDNEGIDEMPDEESPESDVLGEDYNLEYDDSEQDINEITEDMNCPSEEELI